MALSHLGKGKAGLNRDETRALYWAELAAKQNDGPALMLLSELYREGGQAIQKDYPRSVACIEQAAKQGYAPAIADLACMYLHGLAGLPKDEGRAIELADQAGEKGCARGYYVSGTLLRLKGQQLENDAEFKQVDVRIRQMREEAETRETRMKELRDHLSGLRPKSPQQARARQQEASEKLNALLNESRTDSDPSPVADFLGGGSPEETASWDERRRQACEERPPWEELYKQSAVRLIRAALG